MDKCNTECNIIRSVNTKTAHDKITLQIKLTRVTVRRKLLFVRGQRCSLSTHDPSVLHGHADRQLWINVCEIMVETEKEMKAVRTNV